MSERESEKYKERRIDIKREKEKGDFISKPWEKEKLLATISSAMKLRESHKQITSLREQVESLSSSFVKPEDVIGESEPMKDIFATVGKLAETDANIMIFGENGTGKDVIARMIHQNSTRKDHPFVTIDLGAIPENLFESELFGYEKGAFTDAKKSKAGRIEVANGGTLFLDEIGNLTPSMQAKLLTAIEKKMISRLGSTQSINVDIRIIAATNADIHKMTDEGMFREDLLYRINTIEINMPPLRDRGNDIILLADHFMDIYSKKYKKTISSFSREARQVLLKYKWPGNVRELQHSVERAVIMCEERTIGSELFRLNKSGKNDIKGENLNVEVLEKEAIEKAMKRAAGNVSKAAEMLGITRFALYRKIEKYEL